VIFNLRMPAAWQVPTAWQRPGRVARRIIARLRCKTDELRDTTDVDAMRVLDYQVAVMVPRFEGFPGREVTLVRTGGVA